VSDHPQIIVNAKVYPQVTGHDGCHGLAAACEEAAEEFGTIIGLAPPQLELSRLAALEYPNVQLFAQHADPHVPGSGTGKVTAEAVQAAGAVGSLLNHAEYKIPHEQVATTLGRLHGLGLETLVCADGDAEVNALAKLNPTYIAVEPPELIGGDISVTSADPSVIERNVATITELSPNTLPLCGAGVKTGADVAKAIELGAYGVLLASGVVKHEKPLMALRNLCSGL
jgi:triosephosphate isomerase